MGEIRKRGNIWWIRYYRNGRRHEESSRSTKRGEAERLLKLREGDVARGVPITPQVGRLRFDEAAADLVTDYRVNGKRSLGHLERRVDLHLSKFFGGRRMANLSTSDIRTYVSLRQAAGAANGSINRELAVIKRMFTLAIAAGKLIHRPHIPMLAEDNVRTGFFERDQFDGVCSHLPAALRPVVTFAYFTGWRIQSEVLPLEWRRVDRRRGDARLDPGSTKNKAGRQFPYGDLLPELAETIDAQWAYTKRIEQERRIVCPWVFHRNGRPVRSLQGAWRKACAAAGCPNRIPHDLRRTAVRNLVRAGVPENVAMQLTGHKTRSVFDRYDIVNEADLQEAVRKLGAAHVDVGRSTPILRMSRPDRRKPEPPQVNGGPETASR